MILDVKETIHTVSHAGHFVEFSGLAGTLLPGPFPAYILPILGNRLYLDLAYPKHPRTLGGHIRKLRKDKGLLIKEFAAQIGVSEDTVINWEVRGRIPSREGQEALRVVFPEITLEA